MRMEGVSDAGREIIVAGRGAEARHVKIDFVQVAAQFLQQALNVFFRFGVMNELGLELFENGGVFLDRQLELRGLRIERSKSLDAQFMRQLAQRLRFRARGKDAERAIEKTAATGVVGKGRVKINSVHS